MRVETSRLLVTFFVLAAFLFGQATALEHAAQHGGQVHTLADHGDGDQDSHGDGLCDLSIYAAGQALALSDSPALCGPIPFASVAFAPTATALMGSVSITGPPVRGPPHLS